MNIPFEIDREMLHAHRDLPPAKLRELALYLDKLNAAHLADGEEPDVRWADYYPEPASAAAVGSSHEAHRESVPSRDGRQADGAG